MLVEHKIRAIAGTFILLSVAGAVWISPHFLWFTAFVGANLLQSAFTKWCLMEIILKKCFGETGSCCGGVSNCCEDQAKQP